MISKEEEFALALAKLEDERLEHCEEKYEVKSYLNDEFYFDIEVEHSPTKVYHILQKVWTEGLLEIFIRNHILTHKLEVKDLIAFDSARFTKLVLEVLNLKLIEEKEAWGLLFLNASRVQDSFQNAHEFKASYFKGSLFYDILFKSEEEEKVAKIENFDALLQDLEENTKVELPWLEENIFESFSIEKEHSPAPAIDLEAYMNELWNGLDALSMEERNEVLPQLYMKEKALGLKAEDYLELPALYPKVAYAHYLRGVYFYHYAWEARGLGITNTVGQKNYALFYERLRHARADLKKAYELSPNEQSYWAELYNLVKHFKNKESDHLEDDLYRLITEHAMQNNYCIQRVAHMKKARWGGSHKESLAWAREVIEHSAKGSTAKVIIFETLIEQYNYILEYDRDEEKANAVFKDIGLQKEVNLYFDELLATDKSVEETLLFWYEKVEDAERLKKLRDNLI